MCSIKYFQKFGRLFAVLAINFCLSLSVTANAQTVLPLPTGVFTFGGEVEVSALQADGKIVIGGLFTAVNGVARQNIARLNSDGSLDMTWNPGANGNPEHRFHAIVVSDSIIYVGGNFSSIGGELRSNIAAIDAITGQVTDWNPGANNWVTELSVSGGVVYASGAFSFIGHQSRNGIAALDVATGQATAWNPAGYSATNVNDVRALIVSGNIVYVAGAFSNLGNQPRLNIAAIDATTGMATSWNPGASGRVSSIALDGNTVYIGGSFLFVGGQVREGVASIDATTGITTSWNPLAEDLSGYPGDVFALVVSGNTIYMGGRFARAGSQPRSNIAAIDTSTGLVTNWNPGADSPVATLTVSGSTVFAGGQFTNVGDQPAGGFVGIDAFSGTLSEKPRLYVPGSVTAFQEQLDGKIIVGGDFIAVGDVTRHNIARLNTDGSVDMSWNVVSDGAVAALVIAANTVYVGGYFDNIGGESRTNIAAIDATTGQATAWNPGANHPVKALAIDGATVYAGGSFDFIGSQPRSKIAAISVTTGQTTTWDPSISSSGSVEVIAVSSNTVYVGGSFSLAGGESRKNIAAVDAATGQVTTWNPGQNSGGNLVYALAISGDTVYVGGSFYDIGGQSRSNAAAIDVTTGLATDWNPNISGNHVATLALDGNIIYVGGRFASAGGQPRSSMAAINATTGLALDWDPGAQLAGSYYSDTTALAISGNAVYAGGHFTRIGDQPRIGIAALTPAVPQSFILTYSAGAHGSISGDAAQSVAIGADGTAVAAVPDTGYHFTLWSDTSTDNPRTDTNVSADIAVEASFEIDQFTLTYTANANGSITGITPQTVDYGTDGTAVSAVADTGYHFVEWSDGSTANPRSDEFVTTDINVSASFEINSYSVTTSSTGNGSITPTSQTIIHGEQANFVVAPDSGYLAVVSGDTCSVSAVAGTAWISSVIDADCQVTATFALIPAPALEIDISDNQNFAPYGSLLDYIVTVSNIGTADATNVSLSSVLPAQLDAGLTRWNCIGAGNGASCPASGSGGLNSTGIILPPGRSLYWFVTAPVLSQAIGDTVEYTVNALLSTGESVSSTDIDTLVLYRSGFDAPHEVGGYVYEPALKVCSPDIPFATFEDSSVWTLTPASRPASSTLPIEVIAEALDSNDVGFRIEQFGLDQTPLVRIVAIAKGSSEWASAWIEARVGTTLAIATIDSDEGGRAAMLLGENAAITLRLPAEIASPLHFRASTVGSQGCQ